MALICAVSVLCTNAAAYTAFLPEDVEQAQGVEDSQKAEDSKDTEKAESEAKDDSEKDTEVKSEDKAEEKNQESVEAENDGTSDDAKQEGGEAEETPDAEKGSGAALPAPSGGIYRPDNVYYRLFRQILDVYVENHLYDFTHEEVLYKFFEDFLRENPMYFKFFTNYMLGTMDKYSSYHDANDGFLEGESISTGFGIIIGEGENQKAVVNDVLPGSNAEKAGILPGDEFVSVMGLKVDDLPIDAVTTIIANITHFLTEEQKALGEEEVSYTFEFKRGDETVSITLSKGIMVTDAIDSYVEDNDGRTTGVITLSAFLGEGTDKEFIDTVLKFHNDGIEHLTIDLRDNGGGNLDYALNMVETFIPNGELICYYNDKTLEEPRAVYSTTDSVSFKSIAILVNEHTASAAELFSHILRVKGLAKLVGTNTFGKGIGQTVYTLVNGDYITITSYEILDQNFETYNEVGLKPDLELENIEICYTLPALGYFNHENYKEIKEGVYSEPSKALEDRLVVAGLMKEEHCDGIFDDTTRRALYALQLYVNVEPTGVLDDETVTGITRLINSYKTYTYYEDSQYEVSLYMHRSFSQGKRRLAEIVSKGEKEQEKIEERDKAIEEALDKSEKEAGGQEADVTEKAQEQSPSQKAPANTAEDNK